MSFWEGFEKRAISIDKLRELTSKVKGHVRATVSLNPKNMANAMSHGKDIMKMPAKNVSDFTTISKKVHKDNVDMGPTFSVMHNKILASSSISANKNVKPILKQTSGNMSGEQKEFMNRTLMAHEMDEAKNLRKFKKPVEQGMTVRQFQEKTFNTHANPGIIMREGNLLASAPQDVAEPTKKFLGHIRNMDATAPTIKEVMPSYEHGKTRLSRHAIKHISNRIMKDRPRLFEEAFGKAK